MATPSRPIFALAVVPAAIQSGRWSGKDLAWAFNNRCRAYNDNNETDRAIADCTDAIRLDPNYAGAYDNRGIAYRTKSDYDRVEATRLHPH